MATFCKVRVGAHVVSQALSRGRGTNQAYIYTRDAAEADHDHTPPVAGGELHHLRRGTNYSAARYLRSIVGNDDRPPSPVPCMSKPDRPTANSSPMSSAGCWTADQRLISRADAWRQHIAQARDFRAAGERMMSAADRTADRSRAKDVGGLEL